MLTFGSAKDAAVVFSGVPLALNRWCYCPVVNRHCAFYYGGRGVYYPCRCSVLTGVMMVSAFKAQLNEGLALDNALVQGALLRLRPVLMVALVAALGFLPMALNSGTGAEVQRPLAVVVIGGIISSTLLSLLVLPGLYRMAYGGRK